MESSKRQGLRISRVSCCVVGCRNSYANTTEEVKFYSFPNKPHERNRRKIWINSVRRYTKTGKPWEPKNFHRICSSHFVGNCKSNIELSPSYNPTIFPEIGKLKMDQNIQFNDEFKRRRELANARLKKYRKRKREEAQHQNSVSQDEQIIQQNILERKRELANARLRKHRQRKWEEAQLQNLDSQDGLDEQSIQQNILERQREFARERSRRYRAKKRLCRITSVEDAIPGHSNPNHSEDKPDEQKRNILERQKEFARERCRRYRAKKRLCSTSVENAIHGSPIPEPLNCDPPPLVRIQRTTIHNSQIPRTSTTMNIPVDVNDDSQHLNYSFHKQFTQNSLHACKICDRLWFKNDLKNLNDENMEFVRTFLPNVEEHSIAVCSTCRSSIQKNSIPEMAVYNGFEYPTIPEHLTICSLDRLQQNQPDIVDHTYSTANQTILTIKPEPVEVEEHPIIIKKECIELEDPIGIDLDLPQDSLTTFAEDLIPIKQEPEHIFIKQEVEFSHYSSEVLETRIDQPLSSRTNTENRNDHQKLISREDLDAVDLMFLDFAKRFKQFSSKSQLAMKTKFCQIMNQAETEEIEERQRYS